MPYPDPIVEHLHNPAGASPVSCARSGDGYGGGSSDGSEVTLTKVSKRPVLNGSLIGTFKAGRISHLASRISYLMGFVMIQFKFRSGSHETGN